MNAMAIKSFSFTDLSERELYDVNGGFGIVAAIIVAVVIVVVVLVVVAIVGYANDYNEVMSQNRR